MLVIHVLGQIIVFQNNVQSSGVERIQQYIRVRLGHRYVNAGIKTGECRHAGRQQKRRKDAVCADGQRADEQMFGLV